MLKECWFCTNFYIPIFIKYLDYLTFSFLEYLFEEKIGENR